MATADQDKPVGLIHVVDSLEFGGLERVVTDLAIAQCRNGQRSAVFSINDTDGFRPVLEAAGVPVVVGSKRGILDGAVLRMLRDSVRDLHVDVVHTHNFVPNYYAALATLAMRDGPVLVNTCHNMGTRLSNRRLRWLYRISLMRTAGVAMVSREVHEQLVGVGLVDAAFAQTVFNGIPVERFGNFDARRERARLLLDLAPDALVIGCVGRLVPVKNHSLLIAQVPGLLRRHPRLHVVLIGNGPLEGKLHAQTAALGLTDRVQFRGARSDIGDLLPAFDVFALPSLSEGLSIALLEACATGLAIVATAVGGNPEIVRDGTTGCLIPGNDGSALATALDALLGDSALRAKLGSGAAEWVRSHASMEVMRAAYDAFYQSALGRTKSRIQA